MVGRDPENREMVCVCRFLGTSVWCRFFLESMTVAKALLLQGVGKTFS